jgi:pyruvate/2-oxoglutarate/acetoin dehydrogenase E1 component
VNYREALNAAMNMLATDKQTLFIGQGCAYPGTFMSTTLNDVPRERLIEFPVAEQMQAGVAIGLALAGFVPICIYPRFNFMLLAADMLINHLDVMQPHVIVRVGVGSTQPLDPGPQHRGDWTESFRLMMPNTHIERLDHAEDILPAYRAALDRDGPSILVEVADFY